MPQNTIFLVAICDFVISFLYEFIMQYMLIYFCADIWPWCKELATSGFMPLMYMIDKNYFPFQLLFCKSIESN